MNSAITSDPIEGECKLKAMLLLLLAESVVAEYYLGESDVVWFGVVFCFSDGYSDVPLNLCS